MNVSSAPWTVFAILNNHFVADQDGDSQQFGELVSDWKVDQLGGLRTPVFKHKLYFKIDDSRL